MAKQSKGMPAAPESAPVAPPAPKEGGRASVALLIVLASICAVLALSGCAANSPLGKFTLDDAQQASSLAKAHNDPAAQKCYDAIAAAIAAMPIAPAIPGLLYVNQMARDAQYDVAGLVIACQGVLPIKAIPVMSISFP